MKITLARHTAVDVPEGVFYGHTDVPLKDTFEAEAEVTMSHIPDLDYDAVYTSPLSRAQKLATYCGYPDAVHEKRIKEISFGDWEMKGFGDIDDPYFQEWFLDTLHKAPPRGESFMNLYERVAEFLEEIQADKDLENVLIFAHGGVLICAQVFAGLVPMDDAFTVLPPYGGVVEIEIV